MDFSCCYGVKNKKGKKKVERDKGSIGQGSVSIWAPWTRTLTSQKGIWINSPKKKKKQTPFSILIPSKFWYRRKIKQSLFLTDQVQRIFFQMTNLIYGCLWIAKPNWRHFHKTRTTVLKKLENKRRNSPITRYILPRKRLSSFGFWIWC